VATLDNQDNAPPTTFRGLPAVMLTDPGSTQFDLRFRLFQTPVRVHPFFWLCAAFLGWGITSNQNPVTGSSVGDLGIWIGCVFVSILLHEFGHVFAFRAFGSDAEVVLYSFGGLAIPNREVRRRWQRIIVSAAGPGIQLVLFAALVGMIWAGWLPRWGRGQERTPLAFFLANMLVINLIWPLFNLLPIWPLDGGQISREVCEGVSRERGTLVALWISLLICAALAINELMGRFGEAPLGHLTPYLRGGSMFNAIFFALLGYGSYEAIQVEQSRHRGWREDWPWDR
jgi:Zn-dependent protease